MLSLKAGNTTGTVRYECFHTYRKQGFQQWLSLGNRIINVKFSFLMKIPFNSHAILLNSEWKVAFWMVHTSTIML